jgi:hypothetical protein
MTVPFFLLVDDLEKGMPMKTLRLATLTIIMLAMTLTASAETRGWGLGAGVLDGDFGLQARKDFWLGGDISQITGQGSVYFHGKTTFRLDADYHFILNPGQSSRFYPLAGLSFAFNSDSAKFGFNLGGGFNFMFTEKTAAFAEVKYIISDWDGLAVTAGIYF